MNRILIPALTGQDTDLFDAKEFQLSQLGAEQHRTMPSQVTGLFAECGSSDLSAGPEFAAGELEP